MRVTTDPNIPPGWFMPEVAAYELINVATGNTLAGFGPDERDRAVELWRSVDTDRYAPVFFDSNGYALSTAAIEG